MQTEASACSLTNEVVSLPMSALGLAVDGLGRSWMETRFFDGTLRRAPIGLAGGEFFETVEFLPDLRKRHFQNYLALCPNHPAMYRHANGCREVLRDLVENLNGNELEVVLAQRDMTIYLSKVHVIDIKAVLAAEANLPREADDEIAA